MNKSTLLCLIFLLLGLSTRAQEYFPYNGVRDERPSSFLFVHANIVVQPGELLADGMLLIRDGKIVAVGKNITPPADAQRIDLQGKYIYPAFVEPYGDYGVTAPKAEGRRGDGPQLTAERNGAYTANDAIRADQEAAALFVVDPKKAAAWRKAGFGAVVSHAQDGIARGTSALLATGDERENLMLLRPGVSAHYSFSKGSSRQNYPSSLMGSIALLRQTYYDAQWYAANRSGLSFQDLALEAYLQQQKLPQVYEGNQKYDILRVGRLAKEFGTPYIVTGTGEEYQYLDAVKRSAAAVLVPLNFPDAYDVEDPLDARDVSLAEMLHWELAPGNLATLQAAGIRYAITSKGLKSPDELWPQLRLAIDYGLSPAAALAALTTAPAQLFGIDALVGSLQPGKLANFIICSDSLFDADNEIYQTWVRGVKYEQQAFPEGKDIRGNYSTVNSDLAGKPLVVAGQASKLAIHLALTDSTKLKLQHSWKGEFLTLWGADAAFAAGASVRMSLWPTADGGLMGKFQLSGQPEASIQFARIDTLGDEAKKEKPLVAAALGQLRFPFADLGYLEVPQAENIIFRNATVWTSDDQLGKLDTADVAVKDGKIIAVGKRLSAQSLGKGVSFREIAANGLHLTPGIIDEHSHIAISRGVNEGTRTITSEVRIGDVVNPDDVNIYRQLAGGVTGSHLLHGSANSIGGQSQFIKLRWGATDPEELKFKEAPGFIKFALGENVKQSNWGDRNTTRFPQTRMGVEQIMMDGFLRAREYEAARKANPKATRRDLSMEALVEIMQQKRFITCHSYVQSEINMLMKAGDSLGFKVNTFTHILEGYKVADKMLLHGANASTFADWWAYKYEVIDAIPYNAAIMNRVGVNVAINSDDAEMARRLNQEAAKTVKYGGMSEEEALKMITINPARALRVDAYTGSISPGKQADLVLWNGPPLSMYSRAALTLVDGVVRYDAAQQAELEEVLLKERARLVEKMLLAKKAGQKTSKPVRYVAPEWHCETLEVE